MPSLGADMEDGTLREWLIKPGATVKRGDIIAVVDTQKGLIDIEVFNSGVVEKLLVEVDQKVPVGTVMALIATSDTQPITEVASPVLPEKPKEIIIPKTELPRAASHRVKASPLAKKIATENNIELGDIVGTGDGGAITRQDVEDAIVKRDQLSPKKSAAAGESIRMAVAAAMTRSNRDIPHYYLETKVDMSRALKWLTEYNANRPVAKRILPVVLLLKAVALALREVPALNAVWEDGVQLKKEINIGFVVSLRTGGILVPGIRDVDQKGIDALMETLTELIPRAREMKLRSSELSESTFTVTNLGDNNVETVYGIIYPPQVGLVGFGAITEQPWAEQGMLDVRPVVSVTLAADHRATDGATGSRFLSAIRRHLLEPEKL